MSLVTTEEMAAPSSTAGTRSTSRPCACARCEIVQLMPLASGTHSATSVPANWPPSNCSPYIQAMPAPASAIAPQVRGASR